MADPESFARAADDPDADRGAAGEPSDDRVAGQSAAGPDDADNRAEDRAASAGTSARKARKKGSFWRELPVLLLTALVLTFLIQTFLARVYVIPSQSMEDTLHGCDGCNNDRVLVDKISYRFGEPRPGDVVVFRGPESWGPSTSLGPADDPNVVVRGFRQFTSLFGLAPPDERDFVKRVIAVGGQTVYCCDDDQRVVVDGRPLDEPYLKDAFGTGQQLEFDPIVVPDGHLWMMGDNRNNSADSRAHTGDGANGAIPVDNVIGKARVIVLPPSRWGGVSDHNPQVTASSETPRAPLESDLAAPAWQAGLPALLSVLVVGGVRIGAGAAAGVAGSAASRRQERRRRRKR